MSTYKIATVALAFLAFSCTVKESSNAGEGTQVENTNLDQVLISQPPIAVAPTSIDPILEGDTVTVALGTSIVNLNLVANSNNQTLIAITGTDGVVTYFQKESEVVALRKDLQTFLQGVWVAIAQVKGGVHFKLVVDPQNRLTLSIANTDQGIQIDIQVQGTPSQEQVNAAEQQFIAWMQGEAPTSSIVQPILSSSSESLPALSSSDLIPTLSSSSNIVPVSSSGYIILPPLSSVVLNYSSSYSISSMKVNSSSSTYSSSTVYPSSSSIQNGSSMWIQSSSSASNISSSSGAAINPCLLEPVTSKGTNYASYLVEMGQFSFANISMVECNSAVATKTAPDTQTRYYKIGFSSTSTSNPVAGTLTVSRTNANGQLMDYAPCTRVIQIDGGTIWENTTHTQTFRTCVLAL